ncbi:hypothetical protein HZA97_05315 [Candidatus Woesearchaeota archaeon]|nr:hypothetical protein [Candidatus Woesearchaeota archaeon]
MSIFIIEHMEPRLWKWCLLEYEHISKIVGKQNLWITDCNNSKLKSVGKVEKKSVVELKLNNACLLDPYAEKELSPTDKFDYFIFGGILGNAPAQGRTKILGDKLNCEKRSLGNKQMSTDTAVRVTKMIVEGKKLSEIPFIDEPELDTAENESVTLPYRYVLEHGKPIIYKKLLPLIKDEF